MPTYTRLYADANGESHFEEIEIELTSTDYAPPAPPLDLSSFTPATQFGFMRAQAGWASDWHPSLREICFSCSAANGKLRPATASSGALLPGALLVEDTRGKGHASRVVSNSGSLAAIVQLPES